jgi:hypothetical protein
MFKWIRVTKNYYIGFFALGLLLFALQETPYMIMPLMKLSANPIMNLSNRVPWLDIAQTILGSLSVAVLILLVRRDSKAFSLHGGRERTFFGLAMVCLALNFSGWGFYFAGYQAKALILCCLVVAVPLYYVFLGLWRENYPLSVIGTLFLAAHVVNVAINLS